MMARYYNGWQIETQGGFCTMKRYVARKGNQWHWAFLLRDCKGICDSRDKGIEPSRLYLNPLYV